MTTIVINLHYVTFVGATGADDAVAKPLTVEQVRSEKQAVKLLRRQTKELDSLRRRHAKERYDMLRHQCVVFDKQYQQHERQRLQAERKKNKFVSHFHRSNKSMFSILL